MVNKNIKENKSLDYWETCLQKIIKDFLNDIDILEKTVDGKNVIEVTSSTILIKNVREKIENILFSKRYIDEIRFIAQETIFIDDKLENSKWHGKNIVIFTNTISIKGSFTWDVSGMDGANLTTIVYYQSKLDEKDGRNGSPGESGGFVYIYAKQVYKHDERYEFCIKSHGGSGIIQNNENISVYNYESKSG